jgi:hypothetical protein
VWARINAGFWIEEKKRDMTDNRVFQRRNSYDGKNSEIRKNHRLVSSACLGKEVVGRAAGRKKDPLWSN